MFTWYENREENLIIYNCLEYLEIDPLGSSGCSKTYRTTLLPGGEKKKVTNKQTKKTKKSPLNYHQ